MNIGSGTGDGLALGVKLEGAVGWLNLTVQKSGSRRVVETRN